MLTVNSNLELKPNKWNKNSPLDSPNSVTSEELTPSVSTNKTTKLSLELQLKNTTSTKKLSKIVIMTPNYEFIEAYRTRGGDLAL